MGLIKVLDKSNLLYFIFKVKGMENRAILGVDISKKTLDVAVQASGNHVRVSNDQAGFATLQHWLQEQGLDTRQVWLIMEHTGLYSHDFEIFLHQQGITFSKIAGLQIKLSQGMVRGKSDKWDARRIAQYGFEKQANLRPCVAPNPVLQRLQQLSALRERLVRQRAALRTALKETRQILQLSAEDLLVTTQEQLISELTKQIKRVEQAIQEQIAQDADLQRNYDLLLTITGVGKVLAVATLIATQHFTRFANARKFACYCGCAPFEHTSGSSMRKRTQVSRFANKRMKTLLDLAAKTAIQYDKELKEYYAKRTSAGKSKMSSINVVRNKIIARMFAVIKRQTAFTTDFQKKAA